MPPKPAAKKGKDDQEDFSDVPTLPPLNSVNFSLFYRAFWSPETREKLQKYVSEHLPQDRVKTLTRDEIIAYGKTKQIIVDSTTVPPIPHDDPRLKMSFEDQISKAASDRLFELQVHARRAKKERLAKLEEELKVQGQTESFHSAIDHDQLDVLFQLVDFPKNKAEAYSFAKYNNTVNLMFRLNQVVQSDDDGYTENPDETDQNFHREINADGSVNDHFLDEAEQALRSSTTQKLKDLDDARENSAKSSALRLQTPLFVGYYHQPQITEVLKDNGEVVEERKEPEQVLLEVLVNKLEHYGALYVKYLRFKEKVVLQPLFFDKAAQQELNEIDQLKQQYEQWSSQNDQTINQYQEDLNNTDQSNKDNIQAQRDSYKQQAEAEKEQWLANIEEKNSRVNELKKRVKISVEDSRDYSNFKLDAYKNDFISNKEGQNQISSILSAMVTQLSQEAAKINNDSFDQQQDNSTDADSIQDILATRASTAIGEIEYQEEMDQARKTMCILSKDAPQSEEEKAEDIYLREKNILKNLLIPGKDRYLMPDVPSKSQRLREAEKPAVYPFSTLPVDDAERAQIMKAFQELIKNNLIDEGSNPEQRLSKYKIFERNYQSHMNSEIMSQVFADALLQDPEVATLYYPRDDKLLVALYNKAILDKPEGDQIDGQKDWTSGHRVMPDFTNWLTNYADQIVITQQLTQQQKSLDQQSNANSQPLKYTLDEEMMPTSLLDIDDNRIRKIREDSQYYYPDDNSIIRQDTVEIGGQILRKAVVVKDNLTFGIRKANDQSYDAAQEETQYGLVSYKTTSPLELWIQFENQTKMIIENVQYQRNPQKLIRVDPPKPTAEEIAAREEAVKLAQAAAAKNKGKGQQANIPVVEEYKEPEPTWEPEPFNFLDNLFTEEMIQNSNGPMITTTLANGLIIRHLANGDVCQTLEEQIFNQDIPEKDRLIIDKGIVIRHMRNGDAEVLYPRGEKAYFHKKDMLWIVTNNKGMRQARKDGQSWDIAPIPCAIEKDAVTEARMMIREDNVMTISYKDGSMYCQHEDGTQMRINAAQSEIRVEKDGYAPVVFYQIVPYSETNLDDDLALYRPPDGKLTSTLLPDGTVVKGFNDYGQGLVYRYFIKRVDYSVVYVDSNSKVAIVSSNTRSAMNENGNKTKIGQDQDYYKELYNRLAQPSQHQSFSPCIFYYEDETLSTVGASGTQNYQITSSIELKKVPVQRQNYHYYNERDNQHEQYAKTDDGRDLEDVGGPKFPFFKHFNNPRFFVISPDGSGYELLTKEQLEYYFRIRKNNHNSLKQRKIVMVGTTSAKSHYFVTKVKSLEESEQELQIIRNLEFPQNSHYIVQRIQSKRNRNTQTGRSRPDQYLFRQIFEFQEFEIFKQDAYYDDLNRFKSWKLNQVRYDSEFGITFVPPKDGQLDYKKIEDDEYLSKRINLKILKERRNKRQKFQPEEFKTAFIHQMQQNDEVTDYHRRMTQYDKLDSFRATNTGFNQGEIGSDHHTQVNAHSDVYASNDNWRAKKKSQDQARLNKFIHEIHTMINTPTFLSNYFKSYDGQMFSKNNPQKPPSQEIMMRMSHRINRSQQNSEKAQSNYDGYSQKSGQSPSKNMGSDDQMKQENEDKDNPIVALEPEDHIKQGSAFMRSKISKKNEENPMPAFSLYQQEKQYLKQKEQEGVLKAEEHHVIKTKDFNVYGSLRQDKPFVKATQKSSAQSDLNEKFITTECIADRRVKISSMAPRQYINAPSVEQVRKQGQHQIIDKAIENKWTFPQVINNVNSMVTSVLHDTLKRSFNVMPSKLTFGKVRAGKVYELIITIKNEDNLTQRINIVAPQDKRLSAQQEEQGPIAPGLTRRIVVILKTNEKETGIIKDQVQVKAKTDIYTIPIEAQILSHEEFEEANRESQAIKGVPITNSRVKERLNDSIRKGWQSGNKGDQGYGFDQDNSRQEDEKQYQFQTTGSESKLPHLPPIGERQFQPDPKRQLKDLMKK